MMIVRAFDLEDLRRLSRLRKEDSTAMLRLGGMLKEMQTLKAWEGSSCGSFQAMAKKHCQFSVSTACNLMRVYDAKEDGTISQSDLEEYTFTRLVGLVRQRQNQPPNAEESNRQSTSPTPLQSLATRIQSAPLKRLVSPPSDFFVDPAVWRQLFLALELGQHVLLNGQSGCGKTELLQRAAASFVRPIEVFHFSAMSDPRTSLIGGMQFAPQHGTHFVESRFVRAIQKPDTMIVLDELNRCPPEAANLLLSVLDNQRRLPLDESGDRVVRVAGGVTFCGTLNLGPAYCNTEPLDPALAGRFSIHVPLQFPSEDDEIRVIQTRTRAELSDVEKLVRFAVRQRSQSNEGSFTTFIPTRALLAAAEQTAHGIPVREALQFAVINTFSNADEQNQLMKLAVGMWGMVE